MSAVHVVGVREPPRSEVVEDSYPEGTAWLETEVAETDVNAALQAGFRRLVSVFRANRVAMTAPVLIRVSKTGPHVVHFFIDASAAAQPSAALPEGVARRVWPARRFA